MLNACSKEAPRVRNLTNLICTFVSNLCSVF